MTKTYDYYGVMVDLDTRREIARLEGLKFDAEMWVRHYKAEKEILEPRIDAMQALVAEKEADLESAHRAFSEVMGEEPRKRIEAIRAIEAIEVVIASLVDHTRECKEKHQKAWDLSIHWSGRVKSAERAIAALLAG